MVFKKTHGHTYSPTWRSWQAMRGRVLCKSNSGYKKYGGRKISICDRWMKFENFLADMGERPEGMSLDRIDNEKGYYKGNCRWATSRDQCNNRHNTPLLTIFEETKTLAEWSRDPRSNVSRSTLYNRYRRKWNLEFALVAGKLQRWSGRFANGKSERT